MFKAAMGPYVGAGRNCVLGLGLFAALGVAVLSTSAGAQSSGSAGTQSSGKGCVALGMIDRRAMEACYAERRKNAASSNNTSNNPGSSPSNTAVSGQIVGSTDRPVRFWYSVGLVAGPKNARNSVCYSNLVSLSEKIDRDERGVRNKVQALVATHQSKFLERCRQIGRVDGVPVAHIEGFTSDFRYGGFHPGDYPVTLP